MTQSAEKAVKNFTGEVIAEYQFAGKKTVGLLSFFSKQESPDTKLAQKLDDLIAQHGRSTLNLYVDGSRTLLDVVRSPTFISDAAQTLGLETSFFPELEQKLIANGAKTSEELRRSALVKEQQRWNNQSSAIARSALDQQSPESSIPKGQFLKEFEAQEQRRQQTPTHLYVR